jgi:MFS family permease
VHYAIATVLMVFYGTQVCPYIDSLPLGEVTASFAVAMLLALVVRNRIVAGWAEDRGFLRRLLRLDCAVLVCAAVAIGAFNMLAHQFPLGSGFKVLFGISGLGLFIVVDTAISEATRIMKLRDDRGESIDSDSPYVPLVGRFVGVVTIGVVVMAGIMVMLIYKDFEWLQQLSDANRAQANLAVLIEFTLVAIVFLAYLIKVMANYGRQLNWLLQRERNVLAAVGQGQLKTRIPVISHDELGEIAQLTNRMIERLEHQNREIKSTQEVTILSLASLADVYDALRSKRVYKEASSHEKSRTIIVDGRGSHFDPDVVDAFIAVEDEFIRVANTYLDNDENPLCAGRAN